MSYLFMRSALLPSSDMVLQLYELRLWVLYFISFYYFYFFFFKLFFLAFSCFLVPIWFRRDRYGQQRRGRCSYRAVRGRVRLVLSPATEELLWPRNTRVRGNKERLSLFCFLFPRQEPPHSHPTLTDAIYFTSWASDNPFFFFF